MIRKIIHIDEDACNGCGLCATACHEGAIEIREGKAVLIREDYCDGLGDCLPACPMNAISFREREARAYDAEAVKRHMAAKSAGTSVPSGCPGLRARTMATAAPVSGQSRPSQLRQWPTQIKLMPPKAPYFDGARLLVAADCTAFAYAAIHEDFMQGHVTIQGCPKLDNVDYAEKLGQILSLNDIRALHVLRMEVPCCGGLEMAVKRAVKQCGKDIPVRVTIISVEGKIIR